jgi:hypothetical protein
MLEMPRIRAFRQPSFVRFKGGDCYHFVLAAEKAQLLRYFSVPPGTSLWARAARKGYTLIGLNEPGDSSFI